MSLLQQLKQQFTTRYGVEGVAFTAPGRINLIGEHTDYNGGFVFPGAVTQGITAIVRPNGSSKVKAYALDLDLECSFDIHDTEMPESTHLRYLYGIVREMMERGVKVEGFDTVYGGDVPLGAGMSSSAALECCFATAINTLFDGRLSKMDLALAGQATEHKYVGVKCGIMDQFISMHGKAGNLVRLDCRSGEYRYFPWHPNGYRLVLINSCVKHDLVGSPYNERRKSCENVALKAGLESLRDCDWDKLNSIRDALSDTDYSRAKYVIGEHERVLAVCDALERDDYEEVGRQMYATHAGLRYDYEVSCDEIDYLVETAEKLGITGSRIMGGGFGGCTINLVKESLYDQFVKETCDRYKSTFGIECKVIPVIIGDGARKL